jgi:hypothetical protein
MRINKGDNTVIVQIVPMQFALQLIHFLFIIFEAFLGFFSLRVLARYQISRFHYKQFETNSDPRDNDMEWIYNLEEKIPKGVNFQDINKIK